MSAARVRSRRRPNQVTVPEGMTVVTRGGPDGDTETQSIMVPKFEGPVAYVQVEGSVTRNMGNYNSIRVATLVSMPCYPTGPEVDRCYAWCSARVESMIQEEIRLAVGDQQGETQVNPGSPA